MLNALTVTVWLCLAAHINSSFVVIFFNHIVDDNIHLGRYRVWIGKRIDLPCPRVGPTEAYQN